MKILYPLSYYPPMPGAAAINSSKIIEFLVTYGHKVMVLALGKKGEDHDYDYSNKLYNSPDVELIRASSYTSYPLNLIISHYENAAKFLIKLKSRFTPDLIISQYHAFHFASVAGSYIAKKLDVPHIIRSHDIFFNQENLSLFYKIFWSIVFPKISNSITKCNIFYVVCSELRDYLLQFKKFAKLDIRIHHNGIDSNRFFPISKQDELKSKFGCETILIFSGSLVPDIGLQDFVPILPEILKEDKETHIIFLGGGSCKDYINRYFKEKKIRKQIHLIGQKKHEKIPYYINNSDIGIGRITHKKAWKYSIPVKCLEYMACKKPFISTPISDDIIKNEEVGIILKRNFKRKDLIDSFIALIEDKNLQKRLGENGYKKIQREFFWSDIMERFNKDIENFQYK
ncbi:MAG: glycosyltransferase family 4 protein [Promethearchaeota archaeon]